MAIRYFNSFPAITYSLDPGSNDTPNIVTDIFRRVSFRGDIGEHAKLFYPYKIKDLESPEILADKLYGSSDYHWVVTSFNNILDPLLDWPKSYRAFQAFLIAKYGSLANAKSTIHHYTKTIVKTNSAGYTKTSTYEIDLTTYNSLSSVVPESYSFTNGSTVTITTTRAIMYTYEYEETLNEAKRNIYLLKKEYLRQATKELENLLVDE